jgi:integrase
MARRIKDAALDSREARRKLKARDKPYYRSIERGLHLGYRRHRDGTGAWMARHYVGEQSYQVESIGAADDLSDADGAAILTYWQAVENARARMQARAHVVAGKAGPLTVADALDAYLAFLQDHRKSAVASRYSIDALIRPKLGHIAVTELTAKQIREWLSGLARSPARARTRKGNAQRHKPHGHSREDARRRQSSANRVLTMLKAALNMAWDEHPKQVPSNAEWARVRRFKGADEARVRYLDVTEAKRLINSCAADFRQLVQGALQTGARYGELARIEVSDFNVDSGTIFIRQSKGGKPRHVVLTDEGSTFFRQLCAGRAGSDLMFRKGSGAWLKSHQRRPMEAACARAKIDPPIGFHGLRHTWASLAVMGGVPLMVVAKNLGHTDTKMVEKHYGHLAPSFVADAIRASAPRFGFKPDKKIAVRGGGS